MKYLTPDSADCKESLFMEAITYSARLCNSMPKYIEIKLLDEIKINIPNKENKIKIGISNLFNFNSIKKFLEIINVEKVPKITKNLKNCINVELVKK